MFTRRGDEQRVAAGRRRRPRGAAPTRRGARPSAGSAESRLGHAEQLGDGVDREPVAARPEARRSMPVDDRGDHRRVPPRLAGVRVREVELDHRRRRTSRARRGSPRRSGVNAPALMTIAAHRPRAPWIASTSSPSWFDCTCSSVEAVRLGRGPARSRRGRRASPCRRSPARARPSRLRFGPDSSSTIVRLRLASGHLMASSAAASSPRSIASHRPRGRAGRRART